MIGELAALGTAICWTMSAVLYKKALSKTRPISANIVRCTCTSIALIVALVAIGKIGTWADVSLYAIILTSVSGIVGLGFGDTLYMISLKLVGVARAVPITCTYPLFSILLAIFLQKEVVTSQVVLGAVVIVLGIWLLSQEEQKDMNKLYRKDLIKGVASSLATAAIWAVSIGLINMAVTLPETTSLDHALAVNTIRILATAVFLLGSAPITDKRFDFLKMKKETLLAVVSGGLVALALGWFLLAMSFLYIPESQAVPISSTSPLFAVIAGIIFLHEPVTAKIVAGSLIVVVGIFLIFVI
ncbi:MAG: DMT family transporter [Candidatus Bathyarchaeota archaeon]|nr:DMT family transporter [Candidatus Bathyarchaeota archaeon]MDH5780070.1 DMT family transporter [Candidatus Bathyarchaeota archaeon]